MMDQNWDEIHDKFLRGIGCERMHFKRTHIYRLHRISPWYFIEFDSEVADGVDPSTVSIKIISNDGSADDGILIKNEASHEDVLDFVEIMERFKK